VEAGELNAAVIPRLPFRLCSALVWWRIAVATSAAPLAVTVQDEKGEPVDDAVVSLVPLDAGATPPANSATAEISQQGQEFQPYVTVIRTGTAVTFPNADAVQHHVYSLSKAKRFEFPRYDPGKKETLVFEQPGVVVLGCNIHDWMLSYLVVTPTPWFAKTDATGRATPDAPAGRYRLEVWHPRLSAAETREVTLPAGAQTFSLKLKPERRIRRTPDPRGNGYK
jgi:plastocyanin